MTPDVVALIGLAFMVIPLLFFAACCIISGLAMFDRLGGSSQNNESKLVVTSVAPGIQRMKLEAVVVCVKFNSWLAWTLPVNRQFFDKLVVVTSTTDTKTQLLCHYWQVPCVPVDVTQDFPFNKGRMINEGLKSLDGDGWVLQLDADIMLPPKFRTIMDELDLDQNGLYGADRLMVKDMKEWLEFWLEPELIHECNTYLHLTSFPVGSRIVKLDSGGWLPNGYFHLWHQGTKKLSYPTTKEGASLDFAKGFERKQRHMLAEIAVLHLGDKVNHAEIQWNKVPDDEVAKPLCFGGGHGGSGSGVG